MKSLRGYFWRYKVAETRLIETVDKFGGGVELDVIINDFMDTNYIRDSYSKLYDNGKLGPFLIKAARKSAILGVLEFICISGDDIKRKFFIYRRAAIVKHRLRGFYGRFGRTNSSD